MKDQKLKKVFTKKKSKDIMKKNCNISIVSQKLICKRRSVLCDMENIILKSSFFIDEENYQQMKKSMGKNEDFFTQEELEKLA